MRSFQKLGWIEIEGSNLTDSNGHQTVSTVHSAQLYPFVIMEQTKL